MIDTVLVTGAAGGIGRSLCQVLQSKNYRVIASDIVSEKNIDCDIFVEANLKEYCRDINYREHVTQQILKALPEKRLCALINNAALQIVKPTELLKVSDWHDTLDINLVAPFLLTQSLLAELERSKGSVVNIASIHAQLTKPEFICYATSKAALVGLTKSMAVELGSRIRVNAICPAAVETPMLIDGFKGKEEKLEELSSSHPINRLANPSEIADAAYFLISDMSSFITGEALNICGGIGSRLHDPV